MAGLLTSSSEISAFLSSNVKLDNQASNCCGGPGKRKIHGIHIKTLKTHPCLRYRKNMKHLHTIRLIAVCSRVCLKTVESSLRGNTAGMYLIIHVTMQVCIQPITYLYIISLTYVDVADLAAVIQLCCACWSGYQRDDVIVDGLVWGRGQSVCDHTQNIRNALLHLFRGL